MKGLILKDLYIMKPSFKVLAATLLAMTLIITALCADASEPSSMVSLIVIFAFFCANIVMNSFSFDEKADFMKYAMTMPVTKKQYIGSKFLILLIYEISGILIGLVFLSVVCLCFGFFTADMVIQLLLAAGCALLIAFPYGALLIWLSVRFGTEKGRIILIAVMVCITLAAVGVIFLLLSCETIIIWILLGALYLLSPILWFFLSVCALQKKEH